MARNIFNGILVVSVLCSAPKALHSAPKDTQKEPIVLERADRLINRVIGGETVKELIDNVLITRGDMKIACDHALHFQAAGKILFDINVHYRDSLRNLWAKKVTYHIEKDSLEAEGSVKITQDIYEAYSRRANYTNQRENVYLYREVKLINLEDRVTLTGSKGFGDRTLEYARVTGDAQLVKRDSLDETEITIDAALIEYFHPEHRAQAVDSVNILLNEASGRAGKLQYYTEAKRALMEREPVIFRDREEMRGDSIKLHFAGDKLDRIELLGRASAFSPVEESEIERVNQMYGGKIFIELFEQKVRDVTVWDNARSIYFVMEEGEYKGANKASGDRIYLHFKEGELKNINVAGGSEGAFYPPDYSGVIE